MLRYIKDILSGKKTITDYARYEFVRIGVGIVHVALFIIFLRMGCTPLVIFNIFSVLWYIIIVELLIKKQNYLATIVCTYMEIVVHTIFASIFLGWSFNFFLYNISLLYVSFYFAYISPYFRYKILIPAILGLFNSCLTILTRIYLYYVEPIYHYDSSYSMPISIMNYCIATVMIMLFATLHTTEIRQKEYILKSTNKELNHLANFDPLTTLRNRRSMEKELHAILDNSHGSYCFLMGDIDNFKDFNDHYGHECGDYVLKSVSEIIQKNMGKDHIACRWGGEEFLMLLKGSRQFSLTIAEKICYEIAHRDFLYKEQILNVTITLGLAVYQPGESFEKCINAADKNLYRGKQAGKNRVI